MLRNTSSRGKTQRTTAHANAYARQKDRKMRKSAGNWENNQGKAMWEPSHLGQQYVEEGIEEYQLMQTEEFNEPVEVVALPHKAQILYLHCHGGDGNFVYDRDIKSLRNVA